MKKGYFIASIMFFVLTLGIGLTEAQAAPDLVVSNLMVQEKTAAGVKIAITDTTKNIGTISKPTMTAYYLSTDPTLGSSIAKLGYRYVPGLKPDKSSIGSNYVEIPAAVPPDEYYIIAKADDDIDNSNPLNKGYILESKEGNNKRAKRILIVGTVSADLPDLIVDSLSAPSPAAPGELIYVSNRTKNSGPGDAIASVTSLYLSSDCAIDASDVLLRTRDVPALAAGESNTRNSAVIIPLATTPGSYYIVAEADAFGLNTEVDEGNNVSCTSIVIALP